MPLPCSDNISFSIYTFRLREEEFSPIEISHTSWATCAMVSTRGRSYDTPTTTTASASEATPGKR